MKGNAAFRLIVRLSVCFGMLPALFAMRHEVGRQKVRNEFFPLHNIIRGDSVYNTFDKQVALIKRAGFDGIEINLVESFDGMKEALDKHRFKGIYFYVKINIEQPALDPRLKDCIDRMKGSGIIIAPFIMSDTKKYKDPSPEADELVVDRLNQLGAWAQEADLQVAIYPHYKLYVQTIGHSLDLVRKINRRNVGMSFNLCHWLATTNAGERKSLNQDLKVLAPYLKLVTVCGANNVITTRNNVFDDYILPLGSGDFDTYGLIRYLVRDLNYQGAIGAQCYNIKGSKPELVQATINTWKAYKTRLETEE